MEYTILEQNRIIEQIHNSFYSMDQIIDTDIQKRLKLAYNKDAKKNAELVKSMGFSNSSIHSTFKEENVKLDEELNDLLNEYSVCYPGYKFITDEKIRELCEKYNLILALPDKYIGDIPKKNQQDLINFKSKHPDIKKKFYENIDLDLLYQKIDEYIRCSINNSFSSIRNPINEGIYKLVYLNHGEIILSEVFSKSEKCRTKNYYDHSVSVESILEEININDFESEYFVAATKDLISYHWNWEINNDRELIYGTKAIKELNKPIVPDPIVFKKVKRGAIIITAWGVEAQDPDVINPIIN